MYCWLQGEGQARQGACAQSRDKRGSCFVLQGHALPRVSPVISHGRCVARSKAPTSVLHLTLHLFILSWNKKEWSCTYVNSAIKKKKQQKTCLSLCFSTTFITHTLCFLWKYTYFIPVKRRNHHMFKSTKSSVHYFSHWPSVDMQKNNINQNMYRWDFKKVSLPPVSNNECRSRKTTTMKKKASHVVWKYTNTVEFLQKASTASPLHE